MTKREIRQKAFDTIQFNIKMGRITKREERKEMYMQRCSTVVEFLSDIHLFNWANVDKIEEEIRSAIYND